MKPLRRRSYLGLELERVITREGGASVRVAGVDAGSPAARAGLTSGDRIASFDGAAVSNLDLLRRAVAAASVTQSTSVVVERSGARHELAVRAIAMPLEEIPSGRVELREVAHRGHRLRALWTLPEGVGPHPAIWLLPGAAWMSEERPIAPGGSLLELIRGFTRAGFATLRVERSGLGDSEGPLCTETDLSAELDAWRASSAHFAGHEDVRPDRLFLYARSLGGMLAPLVVDSFAVRAVAVWGTSARRWERAMLEAARRQYALAGMTGSALDQTLSDLERLQQLVYAQGLSPEAAFREEPALRSLESHNFRGDQLYRRSAAFFQQLNRTDVAAAWRNVRCPVLALHGSSDWLSQLSDSIEIAELAPRGSWLELDGIDHMMHARASVEEAFAEPFTGTFSPKALDALVTFFRSWM